MKCFFSMIACFLILTVAAQEKLVLQGKVPNLYVVYTVKSETSLQSISNQFGQSVTKLSTYNGLDRTAALAKGKQIKIPLTQYNLIRSKGDNSSAPVYHIVEKGETLLQVSKENKLAMTTLRQWNGLKKDAVKPGQALIIGYMVNARIIEEKLPETSKEETAKKLTNDIPVINVEASPVVNKVETVKKPVENTTTVKAETKAPTKKDPPPVVQTVEKNTPAAVKQPEQAVQTTATVSSVTKEVDEGYFAEPFTEHPEDQTQQYQSGDAATFKTISGWSDRKYYVLINDVAPETIVRITAPNNKSICAKVLGPLQETKGGSGLLLRMSNSAASVLGITDPKFTVTVTYFQ